MDRPRRQPRIDSPELPKGSRLGSWKDIATYLEATVRSAQRWEKFEGLPVHRHHHARRSTVYAYQSEIDAWLQGRQEKGGKGDRPLALPVSIAVLPFANLSDERQNEYFGDGLAEEILNTLSRIPDLQVTARTSSFAFRDRGLDIRDIATRLNVRTVLEGSVSRWRNRIRITVQLIDAANGYHLWSERYDRESSDLLAIQDEICQGIVENLLVKFRVWRSAAKRHTQNLDAYNLFLRGHYHQYKWTSEEISKSRGFFEQAVEKDPEYALPYVGMAMYFWHQGFFGHLRPREAILQCESMVLKALTLDDALSEAHAMLGVLRAVKDFDWQGAERAFCKALELDPMSMDSRNFYDFYYLVPMRRFEESISEARRALEMDPLSAFLHFRLGFRFLLTGQLDRAIDELSNALELDSNYHAALWALSTVYFKRGMLREAVRACEEFDSLSKGDPWARGTLGYAYGLNGRIRAAKKLLAELEDLARKTYVPPTSIAKIQFGLREDSLGFESLEKAVDDRDGMIFHLGVDPFFNFLHQDRRFQVLLKRMQLA